MPPPFSDQDRRKLLQLARAAVSEIVTHDRILSVPELAGPLAQPAGAFVTLFVAGRLRGCVGLPSPNLALGETVVQAALGAARNDPRFQPVSPAELAELEIEISVLSEAKPIAASEIQVGRHGLMVVRGCNRGLLLPQVAVERGWTAEVFLDEVCRKAELPASAWKDPQTQLFAFTAEHFSEREYPEIKMAAARDRGHS
jgi:AmmeMemoRadiSam system protein A